MKGCPFKDFTNLVVIFLYKYTLFKVTLKKYETLLLPVCRNDHWFLMVALPKTKALLVLDSLPNQVRAEKIVKHDIHTKFTLIVPQLRTCGFST